MSSANPRNSVLLRMIVSVEDLGRACSFYCDVLGLPLRRREGDFAWIDLGTEQELLLHRRDVERGHAAVAAGFQLSGLAEVVQRWQSAGGDVIDPPALQPWGELMAVVRDPDGHIVCLTQEPSQLDGPQ